MTQFIIQAGPKPENDDGKIKYNLSLDTFFPDPVKGCFGLHIYSDVNLGISSESGLGKQPISTQVGMSNFNREEGSIKGEILPSAC